MSHLYGPTDHEGDAACTSCGRPLPLTDIIQGLHVCQDCADDWKADYDYDGWENDMWEES
ncbi:hypothetical protein [Bifidobacterium cuniculi]|uniref:Uncharacterized protein n=1 Tax=Bifidobacterium cuniculi TaxID=1688 RepID=A0A087B4Z3_9BIFI|nr:hypothetical protein [Bifidobacterium cuniculi]KFI66093.1 hypothetical protein BCUN_0595 [Bifidobacterium cuniculi]